MTFEDETEVEVCCRDEDVAVVQGCLAAAEHEFNQIKKKKKDVRTTLALSTIRLPSEINPNKPSGPGVVLTAGKGTIVCDNTLGSRLELVRYEKLPDIRSQLFPKIA